MTTTIPGPTVQLPGVTFDVVAAGVFGGGGLTGGALSRTSQHTCVFVDQSGVAGAAGVQMPTGCSVGDVFEIGCDMSLSAPVSVVGPSGEDFGSANPLNPPMIAIGPGGGTLGAGVHLRKVTSTTWLAT